MADKKKAGTSHDNKKTSSPSDKGKADKRKTVAKKGQLDNVAVSLRRAYDDTVNETVPDSMMDVLRRLG